MRYLIVLEFKGASPRLFVYDDLETATIRCNQLDGNRRTVYELPLKTTSNDLKEIMSVVK